MNTYLLILIVAEFATIVYAGSQKDRMTIVGTGVFVNMILIAIFAPYLVSFMGLNTNVGSIFYATVVASQILVIERWGPKIARDSLPGVYMRLLLVFGVCTVLHSLPTVPGNEEFSGAVRTITNQQVDVVVASFAAFALSQLILIVTYQNIRRKVGKLLAMVIVTIVCQSVDSPVFYTIAFHNQPEVTHLAWFALESLVWKITLGLFYIPAIYFALAIAKSRTNPVMRHQAEEFVYNNNEDSLLEYNRRLANTTSFIPDRIAPGE